MSSMSRARPYVLVPNIAEYGEERERERERDQFSRPARASVITQLPGQTRLSSAVSGASFNKDRPLPAPSSPELPPEISLWSAMERW